MNTTFELSITTGSRTRRIFGQFDHHPRLFLFRLVQRLCEHSPWKVVPRCSSTYPALLLDAVELSQTSQN